jgi:hypothetical protein
VASSAHTVEDDFALCILYFCIFTRRTNYAADDGTNDRTFQSITAIGLSGTDETTKNGTPVSSVIR